MRRRRCCCCPGGRRGSRGRCCSCWWVGRLAQPTSPTAARAAGTGGRRPRDRDGMMHLRPRRISTALAALVMLLAAALPGLVMAPGASAADEGCGRTSYRHRQAGRPIKVTGTGWPANGRIQLTTCGNLGRGGSTALTSRAPTRRSPTPTARSRRKRSWAGHRCHVPASCTSSTRTPIRPSTSRSPSSGTAPRTPPPAVGNSTAPPIQVVSTNLSGWGRSCRCSAPGRSAPWR